MADWYAKDLGLAMRKISPSFARERDLPRRLPFSPGKKFARAAALTGLRRLLEANDRLGGYRRWIEYLEGPGGDPPFAA